MLENLPESADVQEKGGGHISPNVASVKIGGADNHAYAGVPQGDEPSILNKVGTEEIPVDTRSKLAAYLDGVWVSAVEDKQTNGTDEELLNCLRQFKGKYDSKELADLAARGFPAVYFPLSEHKVHTAVAWIDEFFENGEKLVNIHPTPVPEMEESVVAETMRQTANDLAAAAEATGQEPPPEMAEAYAREKRGIVERQIEDMARQRSLRMEKVIRDDLVQGKWSDRIHELIGFTAIYGTGAFRSPVVSVKKRMAWDGKAKKLVKKERIVRSFEAISPFDLFPAPGMTDTQEGDFCVRVRYQPNELSAMKKQPLWIKDAVDEVLTQHGKVGIRLNVSSDSERRSLTGQVSHTDSEKVIEGYEFWGAVSGAMLRDIGIDKQPDGGDIEDSDADWYEVNAVVIDGRVVYCRVMDDFEDRPIDVVKFYDTPGSFFGRGPLQLIASLQKICNAAGRAIVTNMGYSCGPQAVVDLMQIDPRDDMKMRAMKVWVKRQNGPGSQGSSKAVDFFQPDSNAKLLTEVFEFFQRLADEVTGIPAYANGTDAATGAARTATGLNMLFGAANRGIKKVIGNFDELVKKCIHRLFMWHMEFNPDESIKGDVQIEVTGLKFFVTKTAQANDRLALLARITQDQRMAALQAPEELAKMMREIAIAMDLPPDSLAPDAQELARRQEEQRRQQQVAAEQAAMQEEAAHQAKLEEIDVAANARVAAQGKTTPTGRPEYADRPPKEVA